MFDATAKGTVAPRRAKSNGKLRRKSQIIVYENPRLLLSVRFFGKGGTHTLSFQPINSSTCTSRNDAQIRLQVARQRDRQCAVRRATQLCQWYARQTQDRSSIFFSDFLGKISLKPFLNLVSNSSRSQIVLLKPSTLCKTTTLTKMMVDVLQKAWQSSALTQFAGHYQI